MPSIPRSFAPQQNTDPSDRSAHMDWPVASNAVTPASPLTATGADGGVFDVAPSPNCPAALFPQHSTEPPKSNAQTKAVPEDSAVTPVSPRIAMGAAEHGVLPQPPPDMAPSWPLVLNPQHSTEPPASNAHA
jgi:hypothetical protein